MEHNIFSSKLENTPRAGATGVKKEVIEWNKAELKKKQDKLAELEREVREDKKAGRKVDPETEKSINRLKDKIKEFKERIDRETERLKMMCGR